MTPQAGANVIQLGSQRLSCVAPDETRSESPLIVAAELGYSCLNAELHRWRSREQRAAVLEIADAMSAGDDGLQLAFVRADVRRSLVLVQSNRSRFYEAHHGPGYAGKGRVWRDYYARAGYYALEYVNEEWRASALEVAHFAAYGWPPQALVSVLDGMRRWATNTDRPVLRDIYFRADLPCGLRSPLELEEAAAQLAGEDTMWHAVPVRTEARPFPRGSAVVVTVDVTGRGFD